MWFHGHDFSRRQSSVENFDFCYILLDCDSQFLILYLKTQTDVLFSFTPSSNHCRLYSWLDAFVAA